MNEMTIATTLIEISRYSKLNKAEKTALKLVAKEVKKLIASLTAADARVKVLEGALKKISKYETATEYFDPIIENDFVSLMGEAKILVNQIGAIATQALKKE